MARTIDPERHRAKRRHIMHAAAELFAAQGYRGTTIAQICAAAGMGAGNLFHYYSPKRELFVAIISGEAEDDTADRLAAAERSSDPVTGLLDFVDHLAAAAAEPAAPGLVLEAMLQAARDPELAQLMGDGSDAEQAGVAALLERAARSGLLDPALDIEDTSAWVMVTVGAVYLRAATDERFDIVKQLPTLRRTVERLIRAWPAPDLDGHGAG